MTSPEERSQWDEVGRQLDALETLLLAVPEDSIHSTQAAIILNNVRACKKQWMQIEKVRSAGRKRSKFLIDGTSEDEYVRQLSQLITEVYDAQANQMKFDSGYVLCATFFAWLYDASVREGRASGINDQTAFYRLLTEAVKAAGMQRHFTMALTTFNDRVKEWEQYLGNKPDPQKRLLCQLSKNDIPSLLLKQKLALERNKQQVVEEVARRHGLLQILSSDPPKNRPL